MKYSIIIPCYNVEQYILACLESIDNILPANSEVILIDDGSFDNTISLIESFICERNSYRLIKENHGGVSAARNIGLREAKGTFICYVDSDDILDKDYFNVLDSEMSEEWDIINFNYYSFTEQKSWKNKMQIEFCGTGKEYLSQALLQDKISTTVWMRCYRADFIRENGFTFMNGIYHEDEDFNIQCLLKAKKVKSTNFYLYHYRIHSESIMKNPSNAEIRTKSKFIIFEKYSKISDKNTIVYQALSTYLSIMLLLEISKYPISSSEFKRLKSYYNKIGAINYINTNILVYNVIKFLYKIYPDLVFYSLKIVFGFRNHGM